MSKTGFKNDLIYKTLTKKNQLYICKKYIFNIKYKINKSYIIIRT